MACVVLALMAVSYFSHRVFERSLVPEVEKKATTVGASCARSCSRPPGYGLTLDSLYGVEQTFDKVVDDNPSSTTPRSPTRRARSSSSEARRTRQRCGPT
jgi:hypothetical protein